jgi:hypothetical protein
MLLANKLECQSICQKSFIVFKPFVNTIKPILKSVMLHSNKLEHSTRALEIKNAYLIMRPGTNVVNIFTAVNYDFS